MSEPCLIKKRLQDECHSSCTVPFKSYTDCKYRIEEGSKKDKEGASCEHQYFVYLACVDKCVRPRPSHARYRLSTLPPRPHRSRYLCPSCLVALLIGWFSACFVLQVAPKLFTHLK